MLPVETPRKALITGASSAIGLELCRRYLSAGHSVVAQYFENQSALASEFASESRLVPVQCDLADLPSVSRLGKAHTDCDIAVFLASIATPSTLESIDLPQFERTLAVGALSNYVLLGEIGSAMARRQWGRIVIGSSIGVKFGGGKDSFAYAFTKYASEFLPATVREWTENSVLTNVIRIGVTDTPLHDAFPDRDFERRVGMIPMKRAATPTEIADFIRWFGSEQNSYVSGQTVAISGGE